MFNLRFQKIIAAAAFLTIILTGISQGQPLGISLLANSNDLEGKVETQFQYFDSTIGLGIGGHYIRDSYKLYTCNVDVSGQLFSPALTLGLGFTGIIGEAEKINREDFDVGAVAFTIFGEYDFREIYTNLPLTISANATMAPEPLCFRDTEKYYGCGGGVSFYIVQNAAIFGEYRKIVTRFDDPDTTKVSDDAVFFGFRIGF